MDDIVSKTFTPLPQRRISISEDSLTGPEAVFEKPEVQRDPNLMDVQLPSLFHFYEFKSLSVKPIRGVHQAKFARAAKEKSNRHMADAISSLLPDNASAYDLTLPDYYWLLYYLRLNCYTKSALVHRAVCSNPEHVLQVAKGEKDRDTLVNVTTVTKTLLKDVEFKPASLEPLDQEHIEALREEGFELTPTRVKDIVELEAMYSDDESFVEVEYLADFAGFIRSVQNPMMSLKDRIEVVKSLSPDALSLIEDYRALVSDYGVEETISMTCTECSAEIKTTVSISAHSFL